MKNTIKARLIPLFGVMALVAAIGFSMIACSDDDGGGGSGSVDAAIVGAWYNSQANANAGGTGGLMFTLEANGTFTEGGTYPYNSGHYGTSFTTSGGKITTWDGKDDAAAATYTISGSELSLNNGEHAWNGITPATYFREAAASSSDKVAMPLATPAAGTVASGTEVSLTTTTEEATIYYTIDGSTPTASSTKYSTPIVIDVATTIKAIAIKEDMDDSDIRTAAYTITPAVTFKITGLTADTRYYVVPQWLNTAMSQWTSTGISSKNAVADSSGTVTVFFTQSDFAMYWGYECKVTYDTGSWFNNRKSSKQAYIMEVTTITLDSATDFE